MPHGSHIQLHRSAVEGATPNVATMLEGEPAVNLAIKSYTLKVQLVNSSLSSEE